MKDNLLGQARLINISLVLAYYGHFANQFNKYSCLVHNEKTPSASIYNNRIKCFGCGASLSTVDIVMEKEGLNIRESAKKVLEIAGMDIEINKIKTNVDNSKKKKIDVPTRKLMVDFKRDYEIKQYLSRRKIKQSVLNVLQMNNIRYGVDKIGQIHFLFKDKFFIYRSKTDINFACGKVEPVCIMSDKLSHQWWIVEGLFDALTLLDKNYNVVCLNSLSNTNKFIENIKKNKMIDKFNFIIATDNDLKGRDYKDKLIKCFRDDNIKFKAYDKLYNSDCKDINDMRIKNLL